MKRSIVVCATTAVLALALGSPAEAAGAPGYGGSPEAATLQRDADQLLDSTGTPGVLAALQTPRGVTQVRSGVGDLAARTPVPFDAKFRIGSFTKPFVSATLLQLVGEGRLSLDDTVDRWLPGVVTGNGNDGTKITIRQMLQHTGGIPDYVPDLPLFTQEDFQAHRYDTYTPPQLVALAMNHPPTFAPGTSWEYSNTDYVLAGMVIAEVAGRPWQDEVQRRIVARLGLRTTSFPRTDPDIPPPHALGYDRFPGPGATPEDPKLGDFVDVTRLNPSWGDAAGEVISTTADGNTFLRALVTGKVLRPAQLAEMQKTVPTTGAFATQFPGSGYGLGLLSIPNACGGSWAHGGDIQGFYTRNGVTKDGTRSVVVSLNTDTPIKPGQPVPTTDPARPLIEHALCRTS